MKEQRRRLNPMASDAKELAERLREHLAETFPDIKWSVRVKRDTPPMRTVYPERGRKKRVPNMQEARKRPPRAYVEVSGHVEALNGAWWDKALVTVEERGK